MELEDSVNSNSEIHWELEDHGVDNNCKIRIELEDRVNCNSGIQIELEDSVKSISKI